MRIGRIQMMILEGVAFAIFDNWEIQRPSRLILPAQSGLARSVRHSQADARAERTYSEQRTQSEPGDQTNSTRHAKRT
jgi:hypothetical protein